LFGGISSQVPIGTSTVINDNTSTSAVFDFADATLFSGIAIDVTGNNLFDQVTLGPSIGCIDYADRMFYWGEVNKIQNLLNMGFNGGYSAIYSPLGWNVNDSADSTLAYDNLQGLSYTITGNSSVSQQGLISQSAYQDQEFVDIVSPNTLYRFRTKVTPVILAYVANTTYAWNYHDFVYQDFRQPIDIKQWSRVDNNGNITIDGTTGITIDGGLSNGNASYYQYNYPVAIPTVTTPGFSVAVGNTTITGSNVSLSGGFVESFATGYSFGSYSGSLVTNNISGFPSTPTAGLSSLLINLDVQTNIFGYIDGGFEVAGGFNGYGNISVSYDGGVTFPTSIFGSSSDFDGPISVTIPNITSLCSNLDQIVFQLGAISGGDLYPTGPGPYGSFSGTAQTTTTISNVNVAATSTITTYSTEFETANITLTGINLALGSTGNLLTLYNQASNGNAQINSGNVFIGVTVETANSSLGIYLDNGNTNTLITDVSPNTPFTLVLSATPNISISNTAVTILGVTVQPQFGSPSFANLTVNASAITGNVFNFIVANNANLNGDVLTAAISNWPVDVSTTSSVAIPTETPATAQVPGMLYGVLYSPSLGAIATANINISLAPIQGEFLEGVMSRSTGLTIPSDLFFEVYATGIPDGSTIALNDMMLIPDADPVNETQLRVSYVANPTAFDDVTGKIQLPIAGEKIVSCFKQRNLLYIATDHHIFETEDNGSTEPSGWTVNQVSTNAVGTMSVMGIGYGKTNALFLDRSGIFSLASNVPTLISEELLPLWLRINWDYAHISWLYNDVQNRKTYCGIPIDESTTVNKIILMNTRGLDPEFDVSEPIHVSTFSGKLLASDKTLKFSLMSPNLNYCTGLNVDESASTERTTFCGNFGNMYWLNPNKYTDDDYGQINSYYTTYFFVTDEQEDSLQLWGRKLWTYLTGSVTGVGQLGIIPYLGNLSNPGLPLSLRNLSSTCNNDIEWNINQSNQRVAFKIFALPNQALTGSPTDAAFNLVRFGAYIMVNPMGSIRGR
jgi:hypothetical protein